MPLQLPNLSHEAQRPHEDAVRLAAARRELQHRQILYLASRLLLLAAGLALVT